jgi:hypothetical protein
MMKYKGKVGRQQQLTHHHRFFFFQGGNNPYMRFDIVGSDGQITSYRSKRSARPNGRNANFLERIVTSIEVIEDKEEERRRRTRTIMTTRIVCCLCLDFFYFFFCVFLSLATKPITHRYFIVLPLMPTIDNTNNNNTD